MKTTQPPIDRRNPLSFIQITCFYRWQRAPAWWLVSVLKATAKMGSPPAGTVSPIWTFWALRPLLTRPRPPRPGTKVGGSIRQFLLFPPPPPPPPQKPSSSFDSPLLISFSSPQPPPPPPQKKQAPNAGCSATCTSATGSPSSSPTSSPPSGTASTQATTSSSSPSPWSKPSNAPGKRR